MSTDTSESSTYSSLWTETDSEATSLGDIYRETHYLTCNHQWNYLYGKCTKPIEDRSISTSDTYKYTQMAFNPIFCYEFPHQMLQWPDKYCDRLFTKCIANLCSNNDDLQNKTSLFTICAFINAHNK